MKILRITFQIIVGIVFGIAAGVALSPLFAAISDGRGTAGFFVVFIVAILLAAFAPLSPACVRARLLDLGRGHLRVTCFDIHTVRGRVA